MDFDRVLQEIGEFGRYQKINYMLICLPVIFGAANTMAYVFTSGVPNYRCFVPECDDHKNPKFEEPWLLHAVPSTNHISGVFVPEQCERFQANQTWSADECSGNRFSEKRLSCDRWVFDNRERTIVNDWKIMCPENQWMLAMVGTLQFVGILMGSAAFGVLADRLGRKKVFLFCTLFMSLTGIAQALSKSYLMFLVFAFLNAFGTSGVFPLAFIIGIEMVGPKKRELCGVTLNYFYAIGEAFTGLVAWYCRDWVVLQYVVSAPPLLFFIYYWFVPESVRWLLAKNETHEAGKIIRKAAVVNGVVLSNDMQRYLGMVPKSSKEADKLNEIGVQEQDKSSIWKTFRSMLSVGSLVIRFLCLILIWATIAFVFHGLSLNSTNLSGNKYFNFILVSLVEIPAVSISWLGMNKIGRRWSLAGSLFLCAVTCAACALVSSDNLWLLMLLFLIGKLGITSAFSVIFVHTAEMFPTIIRSASVGGLCTLSRLGALLAPFVPLMSRYFKPLPLFIFGGSTFVAGLFALLLPETLGRKLPETVEDAAMLGREYNLVLNDKCNALCGNNRSLTPEGGSLLLGKN